MKTGLKNNKGFSLVELAVLITLFGLAVGDISEQFRHYMTIKAASDTSARRDLVKQAFSRYLVQWGALPCPASPTLPPGDINAGKANCIKAWDYQHTWPYPTVVMPAPPPYKFCDTTGIGPDPATNICIVSGARFTGDPTGGSQYNPTYVPPNAPTPALAAFNDPVIIGTIPYVDLGLSVSDSLDGWGNRMTYAVSYYLTFDPSNPNPSSFNTLHGVINDEFYDTTNNIIVPKKNPNTQQGPGNPIQNGFLMAFVSHGPDGKGAWNYNGIQTVPCDPTPIDLGPTAPSPLSTGRDNENCNGDSTFLSDDDNTLHSLVQGPYFYDDAFVETNISIYVDKWTAMNQPNLIENAPGGSVGIGTASPTDPNPQNPNGPVLDVNGNIKAPTIQANTFCDKNTQNCFGQDLFYPGKDAGGAISGFASDAPVPQSVITGLPTSGCPATQFATGIDASGNLICANP